MPKCLEIISKFVQEYETPPTENSKICEFLNGKTVLLTGGTGFLGKLILEKLLRVGNVKTIYLLVRTKKENDWGNRIDAIKKEAIFRPLLRRNPTVFNTVVPLRADIAAINLGLTDEDMTKIFDTVDIIINCAATVRFDTYLDMAIFTNVRSMREILKLARNCKNLKSFTHVSTAYSFCNRQEIEEISYKMEMDPNFIIKMAEILSPKLIREMSAAIINDWPNTYTYTKALAEQLCMNESAGLPIAIVRPSIVLPTYKEPIVSWTDNFYGPVGCAILSGLGLHHSMLGNGDYLADLVPCDLVVNEIIAVTYQTSLDWYEKSRPVIYNCVSTVENPHTWNTFTVENFTNGYETPPTGMILFPEHKFTDNLWKHRMTCFKWQTIPSYIIDGLLAISGKKPRFRLLFQKLDKISSLIEYFASRQWHFHNENTKELWHSLTDSDQRLFNFNMSSIDWKEYYLTHFLGLRTYILKETFDSIDFSKRKLLYIRLIYYTFTCFMYLLFIIFIFKIFVFMFLL